MAKYLYPAIFTAEEDGGYSVSFPDLEHCYTQGDDLQDAHEMAADVLNLILYQMEEEKANISAASNPKDLKVSENSLVSLIPADTIEYRRFYDKKAVKKTLTIPAWLDKMAAREDINFSQVLQEALKERLKV